MKETTVRETVCLRVHYTCVKLANPPLAYVSVIKPFSFSEEISAEQGDSK